MMKRAKNKINIETIKWILKLENQSNKILNQEWNMKIRNKTRLRRAKLISKQENIKRKKSLKQKN